MNRPLSTVLLRLLALAAALAVTGCNAGQRLSEIGQPPQMAAIENPTTQETYQPVSLPMPAPRAERFQANSLWREGSRAFFRDQRAKTVGDILTVVININDEASLSNSSTRTRTSGEDASLSAFAGLETEALGALFPSGFNPANIVDADSTSNSVGTGEIDREEEITLQVAAIITQVLPNGNFVIHGRQQVRVNFELRELELTGVIRPEDITNNNTISHEKVAEARIGYGGRGHISDYQQPRYGQQLYDIIMPF